MAEKLKSITKQIPWSLLLKAAFLGALFLVSPLFFAIAAVLFYALPFFRPGVFFWQFASILLIALYLPRGAFGAAAVVVLFFLLLGIKDLVFLDRETAYEALLYITLFLGAEVAYENLFAWSGLGFLAVLGLAIIFYIFARPLPWRDPPRDLSPALTTWIITFLFLEMSIVLGLLPLDFIFQSSILFLWSIFLTTILVRHEKKTINMHVLLYYCAAFVIAAGFVLGLNSWRI